MFIKSLSLHNIRTYERETVSFQKGTTLLTGDIGSGKTTLLLAIEFALFGLLRGKTQPSEFLRHSAKEGSITLNLDIQGKDVKITRGLKRGKSSISQTPGTLSIDGVEESYVATELKAQVLGLLGYPESLLSKSTNLFRYTVYTPQEQVKEILHETVEERKDIIRKIFGVDKYKQVVENVTPYVSDVRDRISHGKGQLSDVKILSEQQEVAIKEQEQLDIQLMPLMEQQVVAAEKTTVAREALEILKKQKEEQQKILMAQQVAVQKLQGEERMKSLLEQQLKTLADQLVAKELKEVVYDKEKKIKIQDALDQLAQKKTLLSKKYGELDAKANTSKELQEQIATLTTCPTCQQEVGSDHKTHINHIQEEQLKLVEKKRSEYKVLEQQILEKEEKLRVRLREEQELEKKHLLYEQEKKRIVLDQQRKVNLEKQLLEKDTLILHLKKQQEEKKEIKVIDSKREEQAYERARVEEQQLALKVKELQTRAQSVVRNLAQLKQTLEAKEKISKQVTELTQTRTWVQELFIPLVKTIEKRVLLRIYQEFNMHFTSWFSMLIDDENLTVRLDEDFTPLIEQHGYDTSIGNLSGGEKTSVALAYRLALNKVLNDYFSSLHTKGLLILDEPTDGFSNQQLDKLRDVLDQIGVEQVIIVSHEPKLESIAQHLISVRKSAQVSKVEYA